MHKIEDVRRGEGRTATSMFMSHGSMANVNIHGINERRKRTAMNNNNNKKKWKKKKKRRRIQRRKNSSIYNIIIGLVVLLLLLHANAACFVGNNYIFSILIRYDS